MHHHNKIARLALAVCVIAAPAAAAPAFAQSTDAWTGGHMGVYLGRASSPDDGGDRFLFDTNLDGTYDDTVRTAAGADAFSPGFCNGAAQGPTPDTGCSSNFGGAEWGLRGGYDWQAGQWVFGVLGEIGKVDIRDAVSAYSTTPAFYTMTRKIDTMGAIRGRAGFAFGAESENLVYLTAGFARARVQNRFATSNAANSFDGNGSHNANGYQYGIGYERLLTENLSLGLEYLMTSLDDDDYRVRTGPGSAPATNPFLIVDPRGTDMRRSDTDFDFDTVRATLSLRF